MERVLRDEEPGGVGLEVVVRRARFADGSSIVVVVDKEDGWTGELVRLSRSLWNFRFVLSRVGMAFASTVRTKAVGSEELK